MALPDLRLSLQFGAIAQAQRHRGALPRHFVARCIRRALDAPAEITVRIVDADEGRALNEGYRGKTGPTNVLTFHYAQSPVVVADVVLCAPVVALEARQEGKTLAAHYAHLLVHGALHAQGWDHESGHEQALAMESREIAILAALGLPNPYQRNSRSPQALPR
jgi:probable rRNA maturation factor